MAIRMESPHVPSGDEEAWAVADWQQRIEAVVEGMRETGESRSKGAIWATCRGDL